MPNTYSKINNQNSNSDLDNIRKDEPINNTYVLYSTVDKIFGYQIIEKGVSKKNSIGIWGKQIFNIDCSNDSELIENEPVLNLASNEYFKAIDLKVINTDVYSANFKQLKNGNYKTIAIFSKKARGMMTRFIIDNNITDITDIKSFDTDGYRFHKDLSTEKELIFTR